MGKYTEGLKRRKKFHTGGHTSTYLGRGRYRWDPHDPETDDHKEQEALNARFTEQQETIDSLQTQLDNYGLTPEEINARREALEAEEAAKNEAEQGDLAAAPLDIPIQTTSDLGHGPNVPDATEGLAPNVSGDASSPYITDSSNVQQLSTDQNQIQTTDVSATSVTSGTAEATIAAQAQDIDPSKYDAAQAQQIVSEATATAGVPQGEAAKLLATVNPNTPTTLDDATGQLNSQGVDPNLSAQVATDPNAALNTVDGMDIESRAQIADLPEEALVSTQLNGLLAGMENGEVPLWAKPAVDSVNAMLAQRGLDTSTIGRDALFSAIIQSALPIAQGNAQALQQRAAQKLDIAAQFASQEAQFEQQMELANLSNAQQAFMQSRELMQQTMLSNTAAENAARQFNATSEQQIAQFMAQLEASINQFNAQSENAMKQFNITEQNRLAALNAGNDLQAEQFNAQQLFEAQRFHEQQMLAREQWNATNAQAIEQSNITWRRNANTAETAAFNAANQQNVQNAYNLTALEQTQLWQQLRDQATYLRQAYESEQQRKTALYQTVLGNEKSMTSTSGTTAGAVANRDAIAEWLAQLGSNLN